MRNIEPFIKATVQLAVQRMRKDAEKQRFTDVLKWFSFRATDVISEASYDDSFRMLETGKICFVASLQAGSRGADAANRRTSTLTIPT